MHKRHHIKFDYSKGIMSMIASSVAYGVSPALVKIQFQFGLSSSNVLFYRSCIAIILILGLLQIQKISLAIEKGSRFALLRTCIFATLAMYTLSLSYVYINIGIATALHFTYPVFVNIFDLFRNKQRPSKYRVLAISSSVVGVILLSGINTKVAIDPFGALLAISSGLFYAIYMIGLDNCRLKDMHHWVTSFYLNITVVILSLTLSLMVGPLPRIVSFRSGSLLLLVAVVNAVVALSTFKYGVRILGAAKSSLLSTLEPIVSTLLGIIWLSESINIFGIVGLICILLSLVSVNK